MRIFKSSFWHVKIERIVCNVKWSESSLQSHFTIAQTSQDFGQGIMDNQGRTRDQHLEVYSLVFGAVSVVLFGLVAAWIGHRRYHRTDIVQDSEYKDQKHPAKNLSKQTSFVNNGTASTSAVKLDTVDFVTARNSLGVMTIAWSLYANAIGAGTAFFPPSYAATPGIGIVGMISNAIANTIPPLFVAFFGARIRDQCPDALSLSHYMSKRYGTFVQWFVGLLVAFNMAMALIIEYTAIASIYRDLVGTELSLLIMLIIGLVTSAYTSYGGLYASLATDQWQGVAGAVLLSLLIGYVAAFSNLDLQHKPFPESLYPQTAGWASIFVMPVSILSGTLLSEASFQRAWASVDNETLQKGAFISCFFILIVVLLFSFGGILVVWDDRSVTNPNNVLFALVGPPYAPTLITVIVVILTTIMNTAAVDSIQNGLVSVVSSNFLVDRNVWWSRSLAWSLNGLCLLVGYTGSSSIVSLFAITNIITTMASVFFTGLFDPNGTYITGRGVVFGFIFSFMSLWVYGAVMTDGNMLDALTFVFMEDVYNYPPFLIALVASFLGLALFEGCRMGHAKGFMRFICSLFSSS